MSTAAAPVRSRSAALASAVAATSRAVASALTDSAQGMPDDQPMDFAGIARVQKDWMPNDLLTMGSIAYTGGAALVSRDELLSTSDFVTIHLVLSDRTRGLIGRAELARMKKGAILVNTSRGPIVDEAALVEALRSKHLAAAGLDVYDVEPLPHGHVLTTLDNAVLAPHLGYVDEATFRVFYRDSLENLLAWLDGKPIRVINPDALGARA